MSERFYGAALAAVTAAAVIALPAAFAPARAAGDPAAGKQVYQTMCSICHAIGAGQNRIGPTLFGVVGRTTGAVPGYSYSAANKGANITWTPEELDKYLDGPRATIPGTKMTYGGLHDATKRANLIAFLATLK
jgi:cytochrome c